MLIKHGNYEWPASAMTKYDIVSFFAMHVDPTSGVRTTLCIHSSRPAGDRLSPAARRQFESDVLPHCVRQTLDMNLYQLDAHMSEADEISLRWYKKNIGKLLSQQFEDLNTRKMFKALDRLTRELPSSHDQRYAVKKSTVVVRTLQPFRKTFRDARRNGMNPSLTSNHGLGGLWTRWSYWSVRVAGIFGCPRYSTQVARFELHARRYAGR